MLQPPLLVFCSDLAFSPVLSPCQAASTLGCSEGVCMGGTLMSLAQGRGLGSHLSPRSPHSSRSAPAQATTTASALYPCNKHQLRSRPKRVWQASALPSMGISLRAWKHRGSRKEMPILRSKRMLHSRAGVPCQNGGAGASGFKFSGYKVRGFLPFYLNK